jgi:hypothetical protein
MNVAVGKMATEMNVEEHEQETMAAMNQAAGFVAGRERETLDLLLDVMGRIQKDEMLKKEAEAFAQQVMEEEEAESAEEMRRAETSRDHADRFEQEWVERVRGKLQGSVAEVASSTAPASTPSAAGQQAASKSSVLSGWRAAMAADEQIKNQLKMDDEWAHWADDDTSPTKH